MIGKLKGTIDEIGDDYVLVDVHGVCYVAYCSARTLSKLGSVGEACVLFIETYVREDQLKLFGFQTQLEREWFNLLQSVQGVGAKVALAVLSALTPPELANAIALQDKAAVSRAQGVGPKVAVRIVTELKNKAPAFAGEAINIGLKQEIGEGVAAAPVADAVSALTNLGYSRDQAANAVAAAMKTAGEDADSAKLIRLGLRELSR
ncbi:Holliday junction DNA helicase RuvA [Rhizobium sp. BK529]|uniref:Holliday junction branch migration protein RuvA n=1 Tax=unclassified Rhizobium TaxID=2613769 RepID=UPI00104F1A02|nr:MULTISPECIES: Holliday junction branch migration protein RuvA [unclassified Rhizobium]MBB3595559.1 Holliday junction DNA helicase RuvA [Rhizobium sp. BK529]MBB3658064.1 Holliday junction DNA helicase RuvA [Rhizobium sp. BK650]TCS00651.1 Holliday junction DNA helicase subunit RuvA [Rhizobium sp. BK418]